MGDILVAPSILSCDFARIADEISAIEDGGADWAHVDIMDGHFVDNLTIGPPVVAAVKSVAKIPLDVHLMIEEPEKTVDRYVKAGAAYLTIHVEASRDVAGTLKKIRELGAHPGIALRPQTEISAIAPFFELVDLVLIMTVNPGWGGQSFMNEQVEKVKIVKKWAEKNRPDLFIEVDGGINAQTAQVCRDAGANVFVAGSAVFKAPNYGQAIKDIRGSWS